VLDLGYRHVDVFSRRALQGNGLVVVLDAENLSTAVMQQLTREVRQFETAFLTGVDLPGRSARVRIFTEDEELDFAGHPVLGAAAVLHTQLPAPEAEESWALAVAQRSVETRTRGATGWVDAAMDQGVPQFGHAIVGEVAEAYRDALSLAHGQLHPALPMQVVSTGLPYLIVPVRTGLDSAGISHPDFERLLNVSGAKFCLCARPGSPGGPHLGQRRPGGGCRDRQCGRPSCWLPAASRRPSRRGAAADPSGPVHRAAQHNRGSP
jgi:PhzF family phenazine biosynthesis protein